jgi:hypothetical protein
MEQEVLSSAQRKPTPTQRRLAEEVAKALQEGIEIGRKMALQEILQTQNQAIRPELLTDS